MTSPTARPPRGLFTHRALFWTLLPLTLPQAIRVRRNTPRLQAADGPTSGVIGEGRDLELLGIGDSIVAGVGAGRSNNALAGATARALAQRLGARVSWRALGKIGATTEKIQQRLVPRLPEESVDILVVSTGVNDLTALHRSGRFARNLGTLLDSLRRHSPSAVVAVVGIPPLHAFPALPEPMRRVFALRGRTFDQIIALETGKRDRTVHIRLDFEPTPDGFADDGFHPGAETYTRFGEFTAEALAEEM